MAKIQIEFGTDQQLIDELVKRHTKLLLVAQKRDGELRLQWRGFGTDAIGLASYAQKRLYDILCNGEQET